MTLSGRFMLPTRRVPWMNPGLRITPAKSHEKGAEDADNLQVSHNMLKFRNVREEEDTTILPAGIH